MSWFDILNSQHPINKKLKDLSQKSQWIHAILWFVFSYFYKNNPIILCK